MTQPLIIFLMLASATPLVAADWPQWRGPNRDGKVSGFNAPETWPKQLVQKWKVKVGVAAIAAARRAVHSIWIEQECLATTCGDLDIGEGPGSQQLRPIVQQNETDVH